MRRDRADERGQNLLEMALLMPLLILMMVGVIDLGRAFNNYIIITNASREGARFGSRFPHYSTGIMQATMWEAAESEVSLSPADITITGVNGAPGTPIRVTVTYDFPTIMGQIIGLPNLQLSASTEMVIFGIGAGS